MINEDFSVNEGVSLCAVEGFLLSLDQNRIGDFAPARSTTAILHITVTPHTIHICQARKLNS